MYQHNTIRTSILGNFCFFLLALLYILMIEVSGRRSQWSESNNLWNFELTKVDISLVQGNILARKNVRRITLARVSMFNVNRGIFQTNSRLSSWKKRLVTAEWRYTPRRKPHQWVFRRPWQTMGILHGIGLIRVFDKAACPREVLSSTVDPPLGCCWHWVFSVDNPLGWCRFRIASCVIFIFRGEIVFRLVCGWIVVRHRWRWMVVTAARSWRWTFK